MTFHLLFFGAYSYTKSPGCGSKGFLHSQNVTAIIYLVLETKLLKQIHLLRQEITEMESITEKVSL